MQYQIDENISTIKLYIYGIYLPSTDIYFSIYMQKMQNCKQFIGTRGARYAISSTNKICLQPKESIIEKLDSGYIDTGQRHENNKISSNYFFTVLVYIANDGIILPYSWTDKR